VREVARNAQSRAEAVLYLKEKVSEAFAQASSLHVKKQITFAELGETYLQNYAKSNKKSWKDDEYRINANLKPFFGDMLLKDVTPLKIENYRTARLESPVTKSTVNREITIMKRMFNLAIDWNFADVNPVLKIKLFSEMDTQKERILTEEEEAKLLLASPDYLRPIIVMALNTGMRRGEILNLKWNQVDLRNRQIRVEQTKSGKTRIIPINDVLLQELLNVKAANGQSEHVFPNPKTGLPYTDVKKSFKKACGKVGIEDLRFHDLRHTFATRLLVSGVDIVTVRDLLGHFSVRITQRYIHSNQDQKREAVQKLSRKTLKQAENLEDLAHIWHIEKTGDSGKGVKSSLLVN
jgi:integrase